MAFVVDAQDPAAGIPVPPPHPLAPLNAAEIEAAASAVRAGKGLSDTARFVYVSLYEPSKGEVTAFEAGGPVPDRLVKAVIRERAEHATYEGVVRLPDGEVVSYQRVPGVQPSNRVIGPLQPVDAGRRDG